MAEPVPLSTRPWLHCAPTLAGTSFACFNFGVVQTLRAARFFAQFVKAFRQSKHSLSLRRRRHHVFPSYRKEMRRNNVSQILKELTVLWIDVTRGSSKAFLPIDHNLYK